VKKSFANHTSCLPITLTFWPVENREWRTISNFDSRRSTGSTAALLTTSSTAILKAHTLNLKYIGHERSPWRCRLIPFTLAIRGQPVESWFRLMVVDTSRTMLHLTHLRGYPKAHRQQSTRITKASLVCIDCNLYESYRDVLMWCDEFLQPGAIVYLDDLNTFRAQKDTGHARRGLSI